MRLAVGASTLVIGILPPILAAQQPLQGVASCATARGLPATAGSQSERSALALLLLLRDQSVASTIRPLEPRVIANGLALFCDSVPDIAARMTVVSPRLTMWFNSSRAQTESDGPVWQGRGLTASLTGGVGLSSRKVLVRLQPIVFGTQNRSFAPLVPLPAGDRRHPLLGDEIDLPYRIGEAEWAAIDPGESYVKFGTSRLSVGISSATQQWGPAHHYPLVLGTQSAGIPRLFAELLSTPTPAGALAGQWIVGRAEASPGKVLVGNRSRFVTGLMASAQPRFLAGLELGAARFFHVRWDPVRIHPDLALLPLRGLLKRSNPTGENSIRDYNQVASMFARLAPSGAMFEVYGEFYRDDHSVDLRDLVGETDHSSGYTLGLRRLFQSTESVNVLTLEALNGRRSHLARVREQGPLYTHGEVREGHTFRGQPLGSAPLPEGGAYILSWQTIGRRRSSSWEFEMTRGGQKAEGGTFANVLSGTFSLRTSMDKIVSGRPTSLGAELELPYGLIRGANLGIRTSTSVFE